MVVGAYTIINTIGLLVGLPIQLSSTSSIIDNIPINNNFYDYYLTHTYQYSDYYLILDLNSDSYVFKIGDYIVCPFLEDFTNETKQYAKFTFDYSSSINGSNNNIYYIFNCSDFESLSDSDMTNNIMYTSSALTNDYTININQMYFGVLTTKYTLLDSDSIISSITSGLGLMGDITTNFKNGFSALIWNSTDNKLTTFGNFALIFLGVSITFAIVKLCLNLI